MKSLAQTKTADNLAKAFAGESQARNKYTFYGEKAKDDGHHQIAAVFLETADNERAHAKVFFDLLVEGLGASNIKVDAEYPVGFGTTEENLLYAAEGEKAEWGTLYPGFAKVAKSEGFPEVELAFKNIIKIEEGHEKRYLDLMNSLKDGSLYKKASEQNWKCINCGFIYSGLEAPKICPACKYPQGYYEVMYDTKV